MKFDPVKNPAYVATVVQVHADDLRPLDGLDNLVAYTAFGMQALVSKDTPSGLYLLFSTEVQLSDAFVKGNNLYRDGLLNADPLKTGYLEQNRRVKAIKLRGHRSDSLLMPIAALGAILPFKAVAALQEGDVFDSIDGVEVCRKYVVKEVKANNGRQPTQARVRRVDAKVFPQHIDSEGYARNGFKVPQDAHIVVTQKLHGTSVRYGHVPALVEQTRLQRLLRRPQRTAHQLVVGSRRVVKSVGLRADDGKEHFYEDGDLWTRYAADHNLAERIPQDHIVYGELVGFTGPGSAIQKGYTYGQADGTSKMYVYRVAVVTADGTVVDYSTPQMEQFCAEHDLAVVPVLWAGLHRDFGADGWLERRYYDDWVRNDLARPFLRCPVPLSDKKTVDEGVCIRYDGPYGAYVLKAKSPTFLQYESKMLDEGVEDVEAEQTEVTPA